MTGADDGDHAVDRFGAPESDPFHDDNGRPTLGDADPAEVARFAHDCFVAGVDPDEMAALLRSR